MTLEPKGQERRQHVRIKRQFILRFFLKTNPAQECEISQIENISRGGLCFSSTMSFRKGDILIIELRTPYISSMIHLEGTIIMAQEQVKGMIYRNHLQFQDITAEAAVILEKIEKFNFKPEAK